MEESRREIDVSRLHLLLIRSSTCHRGLTCQSDDVSTPLSCVPSSPIADFPDGRTYSPPLFFLFFSVSIHRNIERKREREVEKVGLIIQMQLNRATPLKIICGPSNIRNFSHS